MRTLSALIALTWGCAPAGSPPTTTDHAVAALPITSATSTASATSAAPASDQPGTARCEWSKPKAEAGAPRLTPASDEQIDLLRLATGLPPRSDDEKKRAAEQGRIDDALEGTIGCEVREVRGPLPPSRYTFAIDQILDEVARCLYQPGRARKGEILVRLSFDERGQPRRARVEQPKLEAPTATCIEAAFSDVRPASHFSDPATQQPLTDEAQANASALVRLELDMPAVR